MRLEPSPFRYLPNGEREVDRERLSELFKQAKKDSEYLRSNYKEWLEKYPDMTVVVYEEELVAVGTTVEDINRQLEEKDIPANITVRERLRTKPLRTIRVPVTWE